MVAVVLLGCVALAQIGSVSWYFLHRLPRRAPMQPDQIVDRSEVPIRVQSVVTRVDQRVEPAPVAAPAAARPTPVPSRSQTASIPKPTPVRVVEPTPEARLTEMLELARALRERGDMSSALVRLREAQVFAPGNAQVLSEMAKTYEKMNLLEKAAEHWRKIYDMGESAGIYFTAAEAKLKAPVEPAVEQASGLQPGSVLGLVDVTLSEKQDPQAAKKLLLRIPVKAQSNTRIDVRNAVIQVFFYDQVGEGSVVQTNANISSHWSTLPADWSDSEMEILEVEYTQPKEAPAKGEEPRSYHGYVVRVYYKGELQDMRAEPVKLLKEFPPPLTLEAEEVQ